MSELFEELVRLAWAVKGDYEAGIARGHAVSALAEFVREELSQLPPSPKGTAGEFNMVSPITGKRRVG